MGVSRATFGRIIQRARKVIADALINGKAINVEGGNFTLTEEAVRTFKCDACEHAWEEPLGGGRPEKCPSCNGKYFHRLSGSGK
jgi:rubrerythrin